MSGSPEEKFDATTFGDLRDKVGVYPDKLEVVSDDVTQRQVHVDDAAAVNEVRVSDQNLVQPEAEAWHKFLQATANTRDMLAEKTPEQIANRQYMDAIRELAPLSSRELYHPTTGRIVAIGFSDYLNYLATISSPWNLDGALKKTKLGQVDDGRQVGALVKSLIIHTSQGMMIATPKYLESWQGGFNPTDDDLIGLAKYISPHSTLEDMNPRYQRPIDYYERSPLVANFYPQGLGQHKGVAEFLSEVAPLMEAQLNVEAEKEKSKNLSPEEVNALFGVK